MNNYQHEARLSTALTAVLLLVAAALSTLPAAAQVEQLTLRVNDMKAVSDGQVAIVVRTYASRPISQGQLCLRARARRAARGVGGIFASIDDWAVYSANGDVIGSAALSGSDEIILDFSSLSATVNAEDGPMLVVFATLTNTLQPSEEFVIELDELGTFVEDPEGEPIPTDLRPGDLTIVAPSDPFELAGEAEDTDAGSLAQLAVTTEQIMPWMSGHLELTYPAQIADGLPTVTIDPRYGTASAVITHPSSGIVAIDFLSKDQSLNALPGQVLQVNLPIRLDAPTASHPISILSGSAQIRDADGTLRTVALGNLAIDAPGTLQITAALFADGFESGDLTAWTAP